MNLYERLAAFAQEQPEKTAIETARQRLNYAELDLIVGRIAGFLRELGVGEGDLVGLRLRDTPDHVAAFFAVMRVGAIILPLDWRTPQADFDRVTRQFQPKIILDDETPPPAWSPEAVSMASALQSTPVIAASAQLTNAAMGFSLTSGTTGMPKAFVVTHEQLDARCAARADTGVFNVSDRFLVTLPLAYAAGREHAICVLLAGATLTLISSLFSPAELVEFVKSHGVTAMSLSPNTSRALVSMAREGSMLFPDLRALVSTTGKLQPEDRTAICNRVAPRLIDYYGSTGTGPIAAITRTEEGVKNTAVGRPMHGMAVEIVGSSGDQLPVGEIGRIRVAGDAISIRSVGAAAAADEGYHDGWYYPGDLGSLDPDGLLHLHGRTNELIKRGGLSIYAQEVEQALRRHESVLDAAVVGVPSETLGEEVVAFVVAGRPVEAKEIIRHCRNELASYKVPTRLVFLPELPRGTGGKVIKSMLPTG